MIKVVIIDDEQPARDLIKIYLKDRQDIEIVGEASNGFDGLKEIQNNQPDVVFLDIQMPKINGFEMLELLEDPPAIIFCTAYDDYAIKAFEKNAVDYLLKPYPKSRLLAALDKAATQNKEQLLEKMPDLLEFKEHLSRIVVKTGQRIDIIDVGQINFLEAQDDYVELHTSNQRLLKQQTMKYYERALDKNQFVRIHRRFIVNIEAIDKLDKYGKETYLAQMKTGEQLNVSAAGYAKLKNVLNL
jgi:two-component system LytT family response regulator